jgi:hypothetical protein
MKRLLTILFMTKLYHTKAIAYGSDMLIPDVGIANKSAALARLVLKNVVDTTALILRPRFSDIA